MKRKLYINDIYVKKSPRQGFGVFAGKKIRTGELIEECYYILDRGHHKAFDTYYFDVRKKNALLLGYGSIYNHSDEPNADYTFNMKTRIATFRAERTIQKGEEIFISYGDDWFSSRGRRYKKNI